MRTAMAGPISNRRGHKQRSTGCSQYPDLMCQQKGEDCTWTSRSKCAEYAINGFLFRHLFYEYDRATTDRVIAKLPPLGRVFCECSPSRKVHQSRDQKLVYSNVRYTATTGSRVSDSDCDLSWNFGEIPFGFGNAVGLKQDRREIHRISLTG